MDEVNYHTLKDLPAAERPRERLEVLGEGALGNAELIAIALRTGARGQNALVLAQSLLAAFGGLSGVSHASIRELCRVPGIGPAKAAQLKAALELGRRLVATGGDHRARVSGPSDAAVYFMAEMGEALQEELRVMLLDNKNHILRTPTIYTGSVNSSLVRIGEVFREAVKDNAVSIIIAHNHPSGDPTPSADDISVTREFVAAGRMLDIAVVDHLVIGRQRWISMRERGLGF